MDHLRDVELNEAGEGVRLCFRNSDLRSLREKYGPDWLAELEQGLMKLDMSVIDFSLGIGAKKDGKPHKAELDDVQMPMDQLARKLLDAYAFTAYGMSYEDHSKRVLEQLKELQAEGRDKEGPTLSPEISSPGSIEEHVEPESESQNSGQ